MTLAQLVLALSRLLEAHPEFAELSVDNIGPEHWVELDGRDIDLEVYLP